MGIKRRYLDHRKVAELKLLSLSERFVQALYENDFNPVNAIRQAYPEMAEASAFTVKRRAMKLLNDPDVQGRIQELAQETAAANKLTRDRLVKRLADISFALPAEQAAESSATVRAIETLAKMTGHYKDAEDQSKPQPIDDEALMRRMIVLAQLAKEIGMPQRVIDVAKDSVRLLSSEDAQ